MRALRPVGVGAGFLLAIWFGACPGLAAGADVSSGAAPGNAAAALEEGAGKKKAREKPAGEKKKAEGTPGGASAGPDSGNKKPDEADLGGSPDEQFAKLQEKFESEKTLEPFERVPTIAQFGRIKSKKAVEFLARLFAAERNAGFRVTALTALGKIGTEDAVKAIFEVAIPRSLEPDPAPGDTAEKRQGYIEEMKITVIEELQKALAFPLEPRAQEWLVKNGLTPIVRGEPRTYEIVLRSMGRLRTQHRFPVLVAELRRASSPEAKIAILEGLRGVDEKLLKAALALVKDGNPRVETAAYELVAAGADAAKKHRGLFVQGLKHPEWDVRVACFDTLADAGDKDLVKHARALLRDPDSRVQVAAVQGLFHRGGAEVMEPLIQALEGTRGRVQDDITEALARLTGKNFGPIAGQWESWWSQNKASVRNLTPLSPEDYQRLQEESVKTGRTATAPTYFGLRVLSERVAFIIDCSESMDEPHAPKAVVSAKAAAGAGATGKTAVTKGKSEGGEDAGQAEKTGAARKKKKKGETRLDVAKKELAHVLRLLKDGSEVNILRFNSLITDFIPTVLGSNQKELPKLEPKLRETAEKFVLASKPEGQTNLYAALDAALQYPQVDTIYLLSDGAPTLGITNHDELLENIARSNRRRRVKINIISFDPKPEERRLLQALSYRNYGVYIER